MKIIIAFACLVAATFALPAFDAEAYLSGMVVDQSQLDTSYESLIPKARSFGSVEQYDWDVIAQAIAEHEASLKTRQDRINLNVDFDLDAFQQAYEEFQQGLKMDRSSFTFDAEAYQKMLEELAKSVQEIVV